MRLNTAFIISVLATVAYTQTIVDEISQIPSCALTCLTTAAVAAGCAATDFACQCGSAKDAITKTATPCIVQACTDTADILKVQSVTAEICVIEAASASTTTAAAATTTAPVKTATSATTSPVGSFVSSIGAGSFTTSGSFATSGSFVSSKTTSATSAVTSATTTSAVTTTATASATRTTSSPLTISTGAAAGGIRDLNGAKGLVGVMGGLAVALVL